MRGVRQRRMRRAYNQNSHQAENVPSMKPSVFSRACRLGLAAFCLLSASAAWAERADREKPMNIEADTLRHDELKQISVFTGNVVIEQPRGTMTGQQVTYNLQTGQVSSGGESGGGRVKMRIMPKTGAAAAKGSQAFVEFAQEMVDRVQRMPTPAKVEEKSAPGA